MSVLITGANGLIGQRLAYKLAGIGVGVRAMVRTPQAAAGLIHPNITSILGSMDDSSSLQRALEGIQQVYHLAAFTGVWHPDPEQWNKVNVAGTQRLLELAREMGIERVVVTSTAGVLGPSVNGEMVDECAAPPKSYFTAYEASKRKMEEMIAGFDPGGMGIVIVNPTRLFGAGPMSKSNSVTRMLKQYRDGSWKFLPGCGHGMGNYVWIDDVVEGQRLAMANGRHGERYILGGENLSYLELFRKADTALGVSHRLFSIPLWLMLAAAGIMKGVATLTGREPLITPGWVRKYHHNWLVSSQKAITDLGYRHTPYEMAIQKTFEEIDQ